MEGLLFAFGRVSLRAPCPICGKGDWCLVARDGSGRVLCQRVESGTRWKSAGWLHGAGAERPHRRRFFVAEAGPSPALERLAESLGFPTLNVRARVAAGLGVTSESLLALGAGLTRRGLAFPMRDGLGRVIGIRYRRFDGSKFAERGSKNGLFLPVAHVEEDRRVFVCEGPTDAAAALSLGCFALGRPNCSAGTTLLTQWFEARREREVVILADADEAGRRGAQELASVMAARVQRVRIALPPRGAKDLREALRRGMTRGELVAVAEAAQCEVAAAKRSSS